ncbi:MAG: chromosome segregation protein SMC [Candidatus Methylomirabilis oxyfera]|nr:chromosome segregation protein SMC [Candidatus Methylomirabilis oxyfera]
MRLTRLSLFGFKSFAEKVEIAFEPGITAIVGPNGCGKSNLSDGIRWALGEQSAKLLRGDRMDDLIFAGNGGRRPLGMAEVSLTFTDNYGDIPTEFHEVTVTRRLYRSGESEYLLNHVPCRLRDITDLFLDTGLGGEPYALIEQGSIGDIVSAKRHERRLLIEEAAGIMTYKVRKKSALVKLESAEQNLLRVNDIIHEVERQRNSLKRQANKAERHRAYQERAGELKGFLKFNERQQLREQLDSAEHSERGAQHEVDSAQAALVASEAKQESIRISELERSQAKASCQERLYDARGRLSRDEAELSHLRQMLDASAGQLEERRHRLARLQERKAALAQEEAPAREQEGLLSRELESQRTHLDLKSSTLRALEETIAEEARGLETRRRRLVQDAAFLAERRNHLSGLRERERLYGKQRDIAIERGVELEQQDRALATLEEQQRRFLARVVEQLAQVHAERAELTQQALEEELGRDAIRPELDRVREETARLNSRLGSLTELSESFEGYADGHRYLLLQKASGEPRLAGLKASLAELIETPPRYERAIEALLGDTLQGLVVEGAGAAEGAIRLLTERGQGRATFVFPPEGGSGCERISSLLRGSVAAGSTLGVDGIALEGFAIDLVQCAESDRPLIEALLADGIIVKHLSDALPLSRRLLPPFSIATLAGELLTSRGIIVGGPGGSGGILSRRREISELQEQARQRQESLRTIEASWEASCRRSAQLAESLESLTRGIDEVETDRLKAEKELSHTTGDRRRLLQQIEVLTYEGKSHGEDLRRLTEEIRGFESDLLEGERRHAGLQTEVARLEAEAIAHQQARDDLIRDVGELRVQLTSLQAQRELLARGLSRMKDETDQLVREVGALEAELTEGEAKRIQMEATMAHLQERLAAMILEERELQQVAAQQEEAHQELVKERELIEERIRALRQSLAQAQHALSETAIRRAELRNTIVLFEEALREQGLEEIEVIAARLSENDLNLDEARGELTDLTAKIAELGGVNPAALEEYQELVARHHFLSVQSQDLQASVRSLRAAITEINGTIQQRFNETLETVNGHLDRLWKRLFSGGEARLQTVELEPGEEEHGLELVIHIPGKRATLNLLSGGEKALAALALLLALFETRPSPFCLLDEVDAPLDDVNAERFASLLKELAATSQFILITHNKRTMEVADILYGITMEEHGVSRLLSLRMGRAA